MDEYDEVPDDEQPPEDKQWQPQGWQRYPQQPTYHVPKRDFLQGMTSNDWLAKVVFLSVMIMFIGAVLLSVAPFITNYGYEVPDIRERQDDEALKRNMEYLGRLIIHFGIFLIAGIFLLASIHREDLDAKYRIALLAFTLVMLIFAWFMPFLWF